MTLYVITHFSVSELNKITHLRLDRERIKEIDSLELLGDHLTNIYLQVVGCKDIPPFSLRNTLKCLSIGTHKIINFPFVSNGKLMVFRCPNIQTHYNEAVLCLNFGTPENNEFSIWDKWKIYYF